MIYNEIKAKDKEQIVKDILSNDTARITNGLLSLFMNNIDKDLAIQYAKWAMNSDILDIKKIGIIGMGHIARVYGLDSIHCFDTEIKMIEQTNNMDLIGILADAKDDFSIFVK